MGTAIELLLPGPPAPALLPSAPVSTLTVCAALTLAAPPGPALANC
jgi:hypothetical protein